MPALTVHVLPAAENLPPIMTSFGGKALNAGAPARDPIEQNFCPPPQVMVCGWNTEKRSGIVSWLCVDPPLVPRTWAGVCPESMPYFYLGCVVGGFILYWGIGHFVKHLEYAVFFGCLAFDLLQLLSCGCRPKQRFGGP